MTNTDKGLRKTSQVQSGLSGELRKTQAVRGPNRSGKPEIWQSTDYQLDAVYHPLLKVHVMEA